ELRDLLPGLHRPVRERLGIEMAVQRPEWLAAVGLVPNDQEPTVVAAAVAVLPPLDDAVQRRVDRRPRRCEEIDRHVPRAPAPVRRLELGRRVDRALL